MTALEPIVLTLIWCALAGYCAVRALNLFLSGRVLPAAWFLLLLLGLFAWMHVAVDAHDATVAATSTVGKGAAGSR